MLFEQIINNKPFTINKNMSELNVKLNGNEKQIPAPASVADAMKAFDRDLPKKSLAAKVNGEEVDLSKQLTLTDEILSIEPIFPETRDGLEVLRHSTAHLLAAAVLDLFPDTKLGVGPALMEDPRYGFYYDVIAPRQLTEADLPVIEKKMREMAKRNLVYRREVLVKEDLVKLFEGRNEPLKCELISEKANETATAYYIETTPFVDFCLGPHVPHTANSKPLNCWLCRERIGKAMLTMHKCSVFTELPLPLRKN